MAVYGPYINREIIKEEKRKKQRMIEKDLGRAYTDSIAYQYYEVSRKQTELQDLCI